MQGPGIDAATRSREADAVLRGERSQAEVARSHGVTKQAVHAWVKKRREGRAFGRPRGRGRAKTLPLSNGEKETIAAVLRAGPPSQAGIETEGDAWTVTAIRALIHHRLGHPCPVARVAQYMVDWGLRAPDASSDTTVRESPARPQRLSAGELAHYEKGVREAREKMRRSGVRCAAEPEFLHGVRTGKHAGGTVRKKKPKSRRKKGKR